MYMAVSSEESLPSTIGASLWPVLLLFGGGRTVAIMIVGGEMEKNHIGKLHCKVLTYHRIDTL